MARTLRYPATMMLLAGLAVLGLALSCLGGSVAFTTVIADDVATGPPLASIVCLVIGAGAFIVGVLGACIAAVVARLHGGRRSEGAR